MSRKRKCQSLLKHMLYGSRKYVRGTISLFLAIIITPLLSMTLLLVESIRYQDVIEIMIEIEDLASYSTLANYDVFMKDRFGLLSTDQQADLTTTYKKYFDQNSAMYQGDVFVNSFSVNGEFALSDKEVFERQILAYGEISSFVQVLCEGLDISELLKSIEKFFNADELTKKMNKCTDTATLAKDIAAIKDAYDKVKEYKETYTGAVNDYNTAYANFESSALDYVDALKASSSDDAAPDYSAEDVVNAWNALTEDVRDPDLGFIIEYSPKNKYVSAINHLNNVLLEYSNRLSDVGQKCTLCKNDLDQMKKDGIGTDDPDFQAFVALCDKVDPILSYITSLGVDDSGMVKAVELSSLVSKINSMSMTDFSKSTTQTGVKSSYYKDIPAEWDAIDQSLSLRISELEDGNGQGTDSMTNLVDTLTSLLNCSGLWDAALDGVVDEADFYNANEPQLAALLICTAITDLLDGVDSILNPDSFWDFLKGVAEVLISIGALISAIVVWLGEMIVNLVLGIADIKNIFDDISICGYAAYNFANRTNYSKVFLDLSSYDYYDNIYRKTAEATVTAANFTGTMNTINSVMDGDNTPNAKLFKGAEVEYLLCGMNSELKNQIGAFFNLFMFRLCLNFGASFTNDEINAMTSGAAYLKILVQLLICMGESVLDCLILVNGGAKEHLLKKDFYLTPSGAGFLVEDLLKCGNSDLILEAAGYDKSNLPQKEKPDSKKRGLLPSPLDVQLDYTEHMFWLLLLGSHRPVILGRMQNLVKLESAAYHSKVDNYDTYDFTKTYTYIHANVDFSVKPMFSFNSMTGGDSFAGKSIKQERYFGY